MMHSQPYLICYWIWENNIKHDSELAMTAAKPNFPQDIKGSWWNENGLLLIEPSSPAKDQQYVWSVWAIWL